LRAEGRRFVEMERNWTKSVSHYRTVYASLDGCGRAAFAT